MSRFNWLFLGVLIFSCLFLVSSVGAASFTDIQNSVDSASNNSGIVNLGTDTYYGSSGDRIIIDNKTNLLIRGSSSSNMAKLDGNLVSRAFIVSNDSSVTFKFINFTNCGGYEVSGAAITARGKVIIENCSFINNRGESGTAIALVMNSNYSVIRDCEFIGNLAIYEGADDWVEGGAIDAHASYILIDNCLFKDNYAENVGGAVNFASNTTNNKITNSVFTGNYAPSGGAISAYASSVSIDDCNFINNKANTNYGGALYIRNSYLEVKNSNFNNNYASKYGGAIYLGESNQATILSFCDFRSNNATNGGGIYASSGLDSLNILDSNFTSNIANSSSSTSSAVYSTSKTIINTCYFNSNKEFVIRLASDNCQILNSNFTDSNGYAIYVIGNNLLLSNNIINKTYGVKITGNNTKINNNKITNTTTTSLLSITGDNTQIYNNDFLLSTYGILINGDILKFKDNIVNNIDFSYAITNIGGNSEFIGNNISFSYAGISIKGDNAQINNNNITNIQNTYSLNILGSTSNIIHNNFWDSVYGVYIKGSDVVFKSNNIKNIGKGYSLVILGSNSEVTYNNFTNIYAGLSITGKNNNFNYNNVLNCIDQSLVVNGSNSIIVFNNFTTNKGVLVTGDKTNFNNNNIKNTISGYGLNIKGAYSTINNNIFVNNIHNIYVNGNYNLITKTTITGAKKGYGIVSTGSRNNITFNTVKYCANAVKITGKYNRFLNNYITNNSGVAVSINVNNSILSNNRIYNNGRNGISGISNYNTIKNNSFINNSLTATACVLRLTGKNNNVTSNNFTNNKFHSLHIFGNNNIISINKFKTTKNKNTQAIVSGSKNIIKYNSFYNGTRHGLVIQGSYNNLYKNNLTKHKSVGLVINGSHNVVNNSNIKYNEYGFKLIGGYNKVIRSNITSNIFQGLVIKGSYNIINKTNIKYNKYGLYINGSKNKAIQNIIRSNNGYGIKQVGGKLNRFNFNNIVNKKYNLIITKGSGDYNYNWWGKNKADKIKGINIKNYVIGTLSAPNVLKLKKWYKINIKFTSNYNKKLKLSIPGLLVRFSFNGYLSPSIVNVSKNYVKGKIKVQVYNYYILKGKIDNQVLFKDYIGDSKGKVYSLELYIKMLFKKQGINPSNSIIKGTAHDVRTDINKEKGSTNTPPYWKNSLWGLVNKQPDGFSKWLSGMLLKNIPDNNPFSYLLNGGFKKDGNWSKLLFSVNSVTSLFSPSGLLNAYSSSKIFDAMIKSNGDIFKTLGSPYVSIYGYSNIDKWWGSENWKTLFEYAFGIDKNGNMSIFDAGFNAVVLLVSIFTAGTGGLLLKGGSTGLKGLGSSSVKVLTKIFGSKGANAILKLIEPLTKMLSKVPNILVEKGYKYGMDLIKLVNWSPSTWTKYIGKIVPKNMLSDFKLISSAYNVVANGFKGLIGLIPKASPYISAFFKNNNIKSTITGLGKFISFRGDSNALKYFGNNLGNLGNYINNLPNTLSSVNSKIRNFGSIALSTVKRVAASTVTKVSNGIKAKATQAASSIRNTYNGVKSFAGNMYNGVKSFAGNVYNTAKNVGGQIYNFIFNR